MNLRRPRFFNIVFGPLLVGTLTAVILSQIPLQGLEVLLLDLKQRGPSPRPSELVHVRTLPGRDRSSFDERFTLTQSLVIQSLDQLQREKPLAIVLVLSTKYWAEGASPQALKSFRKKLESYPDLYLYTDGSANELTAETSFEAFPRVFSLADSLGVDSGNIPPKDSKVRRLILHFDSSQKDSDVLTFAREELGASVQAQDFTWSFNFWETQQIYLKFWPPESFVHDSDAAGKVVFLTFADIFATERVAAPVSSDDVAAAGLLSADLGATVLTNLISRTYVKTASMALNFGLSLLFCWGLAFLCLRLNEPRQIINIVGWVFAGNLAPLFVLWTTQIWIASVPIVIASVIIPYLFLPVVLYRVMSQKEKDRLDAEREANARLATQVAHDIRTPLSALNIVASLLPLDQEKNKVLREGLRRIEDISSSLLERYRSGAGDATTSLCHLPTLYKNLSAHCETVFPEIEFKIAADKTITLACTALDLERHLLNLITNAAESLRDSKIESPQINMECGKRQNFFCIEISDNGPGVSQHLRDRLFIDRVTFGKTNGTGFALKAISDFALKLGGRIELIGQTGARFRLTLPLPTPRRN